MPNYCPCCDNNLGPGDRTDIVRYSKHCMTKVVNHITPVDRDSTCNERYQRKVLTKAREYYQSRQLLLMAGMAGNGIVAGDWVKRMLQQQRYWDPFF